MMSPSRLLPRLLCVALMSAALISGLGQQLHAQGEENAYGDSGTSEVVPTSYQSGSFFNRKLGTALRFSYQSQGYGTEGDVVTLGSMKVFNLEGAAVFLDGQATLSDDFGGGFNAGIGYRQLVDTGIGFDPLRVNGISFWTDGQSSSSDNFFSQLGFSFESLGDSVDLRVNGHFPLERTMRSDPTLISLDDLTFRENEIYSGLERVVIDTAHSVVDGEIAKRLGNYEAWAFVGGYHLGGGDVDAGGYRAGFRGYAMPDLALSVSVSDDKIYDTNVMFGITWFVGRSGRCNQPTGTVLDRFREPVLRNNFIAMTNETITQVAGDPLRDANTIEDLRFVHVGTPTSGSGDGTFENPFDNLTDAGMDTTTDDIVFVHSGTTLTDGFAPASTETNIRVLGEGLDGAATDPQAVAHLVDTFERGIITLPESSTDAAMGAAPIISGAGITAFALTDDNIVNNFEINDVATAVSAVGVDSPTLQNLRITDTSLDAILLSSVTGTTVVENTVMVTGADGAAIHVNRGEDAMSIAAAITNTSGMALNIENREGGTITYSGILKDTGGEGISLTSNTDSTVLFTNDSATTEDPNGIDIETMGAGNGINIVGNVNSIFEFTGTTNVAATGFDEAILISGNDVDSGVLFSDLNATAENGNTIDIQGGANGTTSNGTGIIISSSSDMRLIANTGIGTAVAIAGDDAMNAEDNNASVTVNSNIDNRVGGFAASVRDHQAQSIAFTGTIDTSNSGGGIQLTENVDGNIGFTNTVSINSGSNAGVSLANNGDAIIGFSDLNIMTDAGTAFSATGGGTLFVNSDAGENTITTTSGQALVLDEMTIDPQGVTFEKITVTGGTSDSISLTDIDGTGTITLGMGTEMVDESLITTTGTAVTVSDVNSLVVNNLVVDNSEEAEGPGVSISDQEENSTVTFNILDVTTENDDAINVSGNINGDITFNDLVVTTDNIDDMNSGNGVVLTNNMDATVTFNNMEIDAKGTGTGFTATGGGNLVATGTNNVMSNTGIALNIDNQTIGTGGATFTTVNATASTSNGIVLRDITGDALTIGSGTDPGDGGTLTTDDTAIIVDNVTDVTFNNVSVTNNAAITNGAGINILNNDSGTLTFNDLDVRTFDDTAVMLTSNDGASINFNDLVANSSADVGDALTINGNSSGTFTFNNSDIDAAAGQGVFVNSNGSATTNFAGFSLNTTSGDGFTANGSGNLTVSGTTSITTDDGKILELVDQTIVSGANFSTVNSMNSVSDTAIEIRNTTGSLVTVGSGASAGDGGTISTTTVGAAPAILVDNAASLTMNNITVENGATTGGGLEITNNSGGTRTFNGMVVETRDNVAVDLNNHSGGTTTFNDLTADTSTGAVNAVDIQGNTGGTITVNSATINAAGGTGIHVSNNGNANVNLNSLTVTTAAGAGVHIEGSGNVTTGGTSSIATTSGVGIEVENAVNVSINNVTIDADGDHAVEISHAGAIASNVRVTDLTVTDAGGDGVNILSDGTAEFDLLIDDAMMTGVDDQGIEYVLGANHIGRSDLTLTNNNINAGRSAFLATLDQGTGDIRFLIQDNDNLAGGATSGNAVDIHVGSSLALNATIGNTVTSDPMDPEAPPESIGDNNLFTSTGAGNPFSLEVDDAGATVNLDLRDNTVAGSSVSFELLQSAGILNLVDGVDTLAGENNIGAVNEAVGATTPISPPVSAPTAP